MGGIDSIIEGLGGPVSVGGELGLAASTVASWSARQSIPPDVWTDLIALARRRGDQSLSFERLAHLHAANSRRKRQRRSGETAGLPASPADPHSTQPALAADLEQREAS